MNRYDHDARFVRAEPQADDAQWRVVGRMLEHDAGGNPHTIVDSMAPATITPRIQGTREDPLSRGQGFTLISIPFVLVTIALVTGLVTLAFTDSVFVGWLMTGIGGLALVILAFVYWTNEGNSPGAVDRRWARVEERRHDNDTEVRLEMIRAERDVRLARLTAYREHLQLTGGKDAKQIPTSTSSARQLPG